MVDWRGFGRTRWTAVAAIAAAVLAAIVLQLKIQSLGSFEADAPALYFGPAGRGSSEGIVGGKVQVQVLDDVGFWQRTGLLNRRQTIRIEQRLYIPAHRLKASLPIAFALTPPEGAVEYRVYASVDSEGGDDKPVYGDWKDVELQGGSERKIRVPVLTIEPAGGTAGVDPNGMWPGAVGVELRGISLRTAYSRESGRIAEVWQLRWEPGRAESTVERTTTTELDRFRWGTNPFDADDLVSGSFVQLTGCPKCFPIEGYASSHEINKDTFGKILDSDEAGTLSFTTPSYPWAWLDRFYWWMVGPLALAAVMWLGSRVVARARPAEAPHTRDGTPRALKSDQPWHKGRHR
jgi:hypothetical protein